MPKLLLVAPKFDSEYTAGRRQTGLRESRLITGSTMAPLNLVTVAALTPDHWEVDIWDEGARDEITESTNLGKDYDLVGTTAYGTHIPRAVQISRLFRNRGVPVVIGGPGVSTFPEKCRSDFDSIFLGEAEFTWPRFLKEFEQGHYRSEYRQVDRPDLAVSPVPRWDLVKQDLPRYQMVGVQTTRGCPFDCEFCDVIHLFGRKPRHKPIDTVLAEISLLYKLGGRRLFLCDDDFIGDWKYAQDLLKEIQGLNRSFDEPMTLTTQSTIDVAKHDHILKLMADSNFTSLFIGIETPRKASLKEVKKYQNMQRDLAEDVHKIQSYGIMVRAGLIVGFDSDDQGIFQEQVEFAQRACLTAFSVTTMTGIPGTPQWLRLQREGRIIDVSEIAPGSPKVVTNILPKQMTLPELLEGYRGMITRMRDWKSFKKRVTGAIANVKYVPEHRRKTRRQILVEMRRMLKDKGEASKNLPRKARMAILQTLLYTFRKAPHMIPQVFGAVALQIAETGVLPHTFGVLQREIDMFKAGKFKMDVYDSVGMIPHDFEKTVAKVMPVIYDRLSVEMDYKPGIAEAYVSIMKDFLIRWGKSFQDFEDYHIVYIHELCDRHVERWNKKFADGEATADNVLNVTREQVAHFKFIREVLTAVDQELRGDTRTAQHSIPALVQIAGKTA